MGLAVAACQPAPSAAPEESARCLAARSLPGGLDLLPSTVTAIATTDIPEAALLRPRRTCNRLVLEPGLFAAQHSLDLIDWRPWSPRVFAEAERLGRPLLVLSGYSACRACDRLTRGPLSRPGLARRINRSFVPVLVDREERPDVDAYLMRAVQGMTARGGWPSVVFLLADGRPFAARTWGAAGASKSGNPDAPATGTPLGKLVEKVHRRMVLGGGGLEDRAERTAEKMQQRATLDTKGPLPEAARVSDALAEVLQDAFDEEDGTFGSAPFFPRPPVLDFLLARGRDGDAEALRLAERSLEELQNSPLVDADGGFRRYARREGWQDPASERMLADNAAIARTYLEAAAVTGREDFRETGRATLDFLLKDLGLEYGSFAASVNRPEEDQADSATAERDGRVLADANALAISALLVAAERLDDARYRTAAVAAGRSLDVRLRDAGHMNHCTYDGGGRCRDGYLSDQALSALAFLDLDEAGAPGGRRWIDAARTIADAMPSAFGDKGSGGFFLTSDAAETLPLRERPALDAAVPSGNSAAAWLYVRLAEREGEATRRDGAPASGTLEPTKDEEVGARGRRQRRYDEEARRVFEGFASVLELRPLRLPSMVAALMRSSVPVQLDPAPAVQP